MELERKSFRKLLMPSFSVHILGYYGYLHEAHVLMKRLNKKTRKIMTDYEHAYMLYLVKETVRIDNTNVFEVNNKFSGDFVRFFQFDIDVNTKRGSISLKKFIKNLAKKEKNDEFNKCFVINQKAIEKKEKELSKVDTGLRRAPGRKKKLTEELAVLYEERSELECKSMKTYFNLAEFKGLGWTDYGIESLLADVKPEVFEYPFERIEYNRREYAPDLNAARYVELDHPKTNIDPFINTNKVYRFLSVCSADTDKLCNFIDE